MEKAIEGAKALIETQVERNLIFQFGERFSQYQKFYFWTNENINAYLNLVSFEGKKDALSVLASGDQVFNLVTKGITDIDTFDTNALTEYFALGLKRAMILKYNYEDFKQITTRLRSSNISREELSEIICGLLPFMDEKYRIFWKNILDYNHQIQKKFGTNLNLFDMMALSNLRIITNNNYLISEANYNQLRNLLARINITFKCVNAVDLSSEFTRKYDFILLSNILDYFYKSWGRDWNYSHLNRYEQEIEKITKDGGTIFLKYIFRYIDEIIDNSNLFPMSTVTKSDLTAEELHQFPKSDLSDNFSGMMLKRVKGD